MLASRGWFCWRREWKKAEQEREVLRLFILRFLDKGTAIQKAVDEELSTIAVELNDACLKEIAFQKGGLRAVRLLSSAEEERMSDEQVTERSVSMAQNLKSDIKTLLNLWNDERYDVAKKARNLLHNNFMILQKEWKAYLPKELRNKKP